MKRIDIRLILKKAIATILVAALTASVIITYDKAGQFFNSIRTVFADEVEGADTPPAESEAPKAEPKETKAPEATKPAETEAKPEPAETTPEPPKETEPENTVEAPAETTTEATEPAESNTEETEPEKTEVETTEPTETEPVETEPTESKTEETAPSETEPTKSDIELKYRKVKAEGEDIYVSGLLPADVKVTAESVEVQVSGAKVIAAYDIKVFDKDGNEWQPAEPLKIEVASDECNSVTKNETEVIYVPDELAESGKPVDIKNTKIEKIDAEVKNGKVEFEAGHFSVYVIIEHEGGEVVTPRVQFHFIAPVAEDYQPNGDEYTSAPYIFINKATDPQAGNKQVSMIVRDGDKLESIEAPMNTQNTYFYGWYTVDMSEDSVTYNNSSKTYGGTIKYSWPLNDPIRVELDKNVTVSAVKSGSTITSIKWTVGNASGTCTGTDIDSEGCAHVYLAPIYSNYYFVNFHLGEKGTSIGDTLLSRKLIVLGSSNQTEVKVSDIQSPSSDPVHVVFIGWDRYNGSTPELIRTIDSNGEEIIQPGKDGTYITAGAATIDLYPHFVQARYINFDIGPSGNGALFVKPQLIYTSDDAQGDEYAVTSLSTTTRNGFTFGGWYTGADGAGIQVTNADGTVRTEASINESGFKVSNGKIYAYDELDSKTLYAYWIPNTTAQYKVVIWKQKVTDEAGISDANKKYDFETYYFDEDWNTANPVTEAVLRNYSGSYVNDNNQTVNVSNLNLLGMNYTGFQYSRSENLGTIDPQGGTVINVYYDRITYNLKFIFARRQLANNGTETGNFRVPTLSSRFTPPNTITWQSYCTAGSGINWDDSGISQLSSLCTYDAGKISYADYNGYRYYFYVITANYGFDISSAWPEYSKFPNNNRYLSGWWMMANAGLYGSPGQNDTVKGVVSTMDEKILGYTDSPDGNFLIASYRTSTPYDWTYKIYWETLDGVDYSGQDLVTRNNKTYYLADSFTARSSNQEIGQQNAPAYTGFGEGERVSGGTRVAEFYYSRKTSELTFSPNYPPSLAGSAPAAQVYGNIPYEKSLASYSGTEAPVAPNSNYYFDGWYEDAAGSVPFDFANETMPAANKVVYAKWSLVSYQININPNGGVINSIEYEWFTSEQLEIVGLPPETEKNNYATYFDNEATQTIERYDNMKRKYVEISDIEAAQMDPESVYRYVYIYKSNLEGGEGKISAAGRTAVYIKDTPQSLNIFYQYYVHEVVARQGRDPQLVPLPRAQWEATYVSTEKYRELRSGESYVFLAWYEVVDGVRQNTPFDFSKPADGETTLIAEWRLEGGYSLLYTTEYYADNNDYITANLEDWTDPLDGHSKYSDGAATHAMQEPTSIRVNGKNSEDAEYVDYQFLGWQIVRVTTVNGRPYYTPLEPGVYYTAGQDLTVKARYSDENMVIHMQAVYQKRSEAYRRPDVVNLTLNASQDAMGSGTGSIDLANGTLPEWRWPGHYHSDSTCIYFGDTQSNAAVELYKYATTLTQSEITGETLNPAGTNVFKHSKGFKLIGFDLDAPDTDFVPDYPADAVIAVKPGEQHTLYAVWEPMVYLTIKNDTGVGPVTFTVSGTNQAVHIVNQTDGSFSRTALNPNQSITVADGEYIRLVVPYGELEKITLSGTNTLGTGYWLSAKSELGTTNPTARTLSGNYYRVPNTETFTFTDEQGLVTHEEGVVITFTAEKAPHTLILDDNYTGGATREVTFSETPTGVVFYQTETTTSYTLPSTSTRIGWELLGWDENPDSTTPAYTTGAWTITDLTAFFTNSGSSSADIEEKTLFAIWKANADASTVYVWKNVPEPGDQNKDFTFTVSFGGGFRYTESESNGSWWNPNYRWKNSQTVGEIANNTAQNNTAKLSDDFTLKHNQYLKIVTEKNETNQTGVRPSLTMTVTKWQRNSDGSPDTQIGNATVLSWYWRNTITTSNPTGTGFYKDFSFQNLNLSVTEADYTAEYVPSMEIAAHTTNAQLTANEAERKLTWTDTFAGGTVIYTNTRKTADVTIKKTLLPETLDPESFEFNVALENGESYMLDPTSNYIVSGADAENGGEWKIEGIPTGATLTITENVDSDRFDTETLGKWDSDGTPVTDLNAADGNVFKFVVTADTTVEFKNTLKTQKIRLVVVDDLDDPLDSANFTFPGVFEGTKFSAAGTGLVWEGVVYAGEYTLTETSLPDHDGVRHTKLQAPATVNIDGTGVNVTTGNPADIVNVEYDTDTQTYIIKVVNPRMMRVTVKKTVSDDYGTNSFLFTVTLTDSSDEPIQMSNVYGNQGTDATGKLNFTLVNNQTALLYVPGNARVQIEESADSRYSTFYKIGTTDDSSGEKTPGTSLNFTADTDKYVFFINIRQKVDVTVIKNVIGSGNTFAFTLELKENGSAVANYTLSDKGTADTSDDIVTGSDGIATFTLSPADNGTDSIVFTVHKGMSVSVTEEADEESDYEISYVVTNPDETLSISGTGNSTGFVEANENLAITFTNTQEVLPLVAPTAVKDNSMSFMIMLILSSTCFAGAVVQKERKRKGGQDKSTNDEKM